jgi:hypothetical protein
LTAGVRQLADTRAIQVDEDHDLVHGRRDALLGPADALGQLGREVAPGVAQPSSDEGDDLGFLQAIGALG